MTHRGGGGEAPIHLWWIGAEASPDSMLEGVRDHVERVYGLATRLWKGHERPVHAFDAARKQYRSTRVLEWLIAAGPRESHKILGVTDLDLFMPVLTFVFGEAQLGGRAAIVSTARLVPPNNSPARGGGLLLARLTKEVVHELGHSFGLVHCDRSHCAMSRSSSLLEVDAKGGGLCYACWNRYLDLRGHSGGLHE